MVSEGFAITCSGIILRAVLIDKDTEWRGGTKGSVSHSGGGQKGHSKPGFEDSSRGLFKRMRRERLLNRRGRLYIRKQCGMQSAPIVQQGKWRGEEGGLLTEDVK